MKKSQVAVGLFLLILVFVGVFSVSTRAWAKTSRIRTFKGRPPIHVRGSAMASPPGLSPAEIKLIYKLPSSGGGGTIAIIGAYNDPNIENDLNVFSRQFSLPECTTTNACFEKHLMKAKTKADAGWALETSLDVQWAHAIAPTAKILLVSAATANGTNLLKALDYARSRADVVAISMSWGGPEFEGEADLEEHFTNKNGAVFFASSGDNGAGVSWPAASAHVVGVGGTTLLLNDKGALQKEIAWTGSGGGVSAVIDQPSYQSDYTIARAKGKRAVPDVSYAADPKPGFSVYDSFGFNKQKGWFALGGTSAGAPQWAAVQALAHATGNDLFYADKASSSHAVYFRDIVSGSNGDCSYYCDARKRYDYITGLGSPLTAKF